jgi:hypothetical protein
LFFAEMWTSYTQPFAPPGIAGKLIFHEAGK